MGYPTVLIGMMAAARVTDQALCVGPPDAIAKGSPTVLIGSLMAARMGDLTTHGGVIVMGCPTVIIGEMGVGGAFACGSSGAGTSPLQARASRQPTPQQVQEIQDALDAGNYQQAIDLAKGYYGIDTSNAPNGVQYDPTESNYGVTDFQGNVNLGPAAMASPEVLASTIVHETTHSNQAAEQRAADPTLTDWPSGAQAVNYDEAMAYDAEVQSAKNTGLSSNLPELQTAADRRSNHYSSLPPNSQQTYQSGGYPP
jgi:hypothetical protein